MPLASDGMDVPRDEVVMERDVVLVAADEVVVPRDEVVMERDEVLADDVFVVTDVASQWSPQVIRQAPVSFSSVVVSLDHNYAIPNDPAKFIKRLKLSTSRRAFSFLKGSENAKTALLRATLFI